MYPGPCPFWDSQRLPGWRHLSGHTPKYYSIRITYLFFQVNITYCPCLFSFNALFPTQLAHLVAIHQRNIADRRSVGSCGKGQRRHASGARPLPGDRPPHRPTPAPTCRCRLVSGRVHVPPTSPPSCHSARGPPGVPKVPRSHSHTYGAVFTNLPKYCLSCLLQFTERLFKNLSLCYDLENQQSELKVKSQSLFRILLFLRPNKTTDIYAKY